jgi:hypothetical protein
MKVYISATPEIEQNDLNDVLKLLSKVNGTIQFKELPILEYEVINDFLEWEKPLERENEKLSFDDLFELCKTYRRYYVNSKGISKSDYVVLLTNIENKNNWFSSFRDKNIFIDVNGWEDYTGKDPKFGIAYQVVENIFQSILNINVEIGEVESEPNIHWKPEGCINDMCQNKKDVILKLRTAEICDKCIDRLDKEGADVEIAIQIQDIIGEIRKGLVTHIKDRLKPKARPLEVKKNGRKFEIYIEGIKEPISFEAIHRALYIFFLKNIDGVNQYDLIRHRGELSEIYFKIRSGGTIDVINRLSDPRSETFIKTKCEMNKKIISALGDSLSVYYVLNKEEELFKIALENDLISIDNSL